MAATDNGYFPQFWKTEKWTLGKGGLRNTITGWIDGDRSSVTQLVFPAMFEDRSDWIFDELTDPHELFNAIEIFQQKLCIVPTFPNKCSIELLRNSHRGKFEVLTDRPAEYWSEFHQKQESEFIWLRKPTKAEKKLKFAQAFDKRMMFLSAMRNTFAGAGHFVERENIKLSDLEKNEIGLCEIAKPKFSTPLFPEISELAGELFQGRTRFYTPYLQLFDKEFQSTIKIKKAWLWQGERIFEKFAITLGNAIKETRSKETPEIAAANAAFKPLYTKFIGWFGRLCDCKYCQPNSETENTYCKRSGWASGLYRPDWRGLIIANANCNLIRNIIEVYKCTGKMPFAIYHDCLMYFSEHENPFHEFNGTCLLDDNKFTHEWTLPAKTVFKAIKDGENAGKIDSLGKGNA